MKSTFNFVPMIIFLVAAVGCHDKTPVDLIVFNAHVYTVDSAFSKAQAFAIKDGKFVAVGSNEDIVYKYSADTMVDAMGKFIVPGFIDAHCHFYSYGLGKTKADLKGTRSFEEVVARLKKHYETYRPEVICGRGWDQNDWKVKEFPDKDLLDSLFPNIPVYITRIDGHAALANAAMLKKAGISEQTKVEGGEIKLKDGQLTGILIDNAMNLVSTILPSTTVEEQTRALMMAQQDCFAKGLTTVADAGLDRDVIGLMDSLQRSEKLKMRIYAMLNPGQDNYEKYLYKGKYATSHLNVRSIKLYVDGALGSRGACLLQPYSDDTSNYGIVVEKRDVLKDICLRALNYGYQVNVHAIGDSGVRTMLQLYAEVNPKGGDLRWRIEHAQVVDPADFELFGKYSIIPSVQPTHATSDMYWAAERLGNVRVRSAYAYKKLLEQNGWIAFGTDFPIEEIDPLLTFCAAVFRRDAKGYPEKGWQMDNAVSREEALRAMTIWAAKACFEEEVKGSIEPGKYADFVMLDTDLLSVDEALVRKTKVMGVWSEGLRVYSGVGSK